MGMTRLGDVRKENDAEAYDARTNCIHSKDRLCPPRKALFDEKAAVFLFDSVWDDITAD